MDLLLQYLVTLVPTIIAIAGEIAVVAKIFSVFKEAKQTEEFKKLVEQNKTLIVELREERKLVNELLTKIDGIRRNKRGE